METERQHADAVLDVVQSGFPLTADPFAALAEQLGLAREQVMQALRGLYDSGSVRRVGASFSSKKLGYTSTLCALAVPSERLDEAAAIVGTYPGVTHNYRRENRYNLWFTLITRGEGEQCRILDEIAATTGCGDVLNLPATKVFKIRVDFGSGRGTERAAVPRHPERRVASASFDAASPLDVAVVRWAQGDILRDGDGLLLERPFAAGAAHVNALCGCEAVDEQRLLQRLSELKADGAIRRFGAMVRHQRLGYAFNGMTVWDVDAAHVDACGRAFAEKPYVSHCYERPRVATWPYNLYAMVHARNEEQLREHVGQLREACPAAGEPQVLVSTKEYKKTSMRYFEETAGK